VIERIRALETVARQLDPGRDERDRLLHPVVAYAEAFLDRLDTLPVYLETADRGAGIRASPIGEEPTSIDELLALLGRHVDRPGINPASPGHLGYIPGGGIVHAALGDYLAAVTNRYAGIFFAAPGAVRMENLLLEWMASVVGYPAEAGGNLTTGGSLATLIALVTARDARQVAPHEIARTVVYLTTQAHHAIDKALRIAGLRSCVLRRVPMDARYRMDAGALERQIRADIAEGLRPWLVVGSAGTTDTGAIDPLHAIADVATRYGLWFHLDAAYGGFFALCAEGRRLLDGMARSDSLVVDPHKGLFLPYGSGAVLVKDRRAMIEAHTEQAHYMQDAVGERDEVSPADVSPELSRHFRGLRLWLPLKLCGLAPFRAAVEEKLLLARYFHERLSRLPGFEVGPFPDLSVVTFRYVPTRGGADQFNRRLVREIHRDGRVFLSSTVIDGSFIIRLAVLAFRTHLDTIDLTLEILREKVAALEA